MKKLCMLALLMLISGCSTKYILMDENGNPVEKGYYTENTVIGDEYYVKGDIYGNPYAAERLLSSEDVFVVEEAQDYVTYQYKNVRVDEVSPLAALYCADVGNGKTPYLREVLRYHNGFMRATFDCVSLAI